MTTAECRHLDTVEEDGTEGVVVVCLTCGKRWLKDA
jgi:hypothetical protein